MIQAIAPKSVLLMVVLCTSPCAGCASFMADTKGKKSKDSSWSLFKKKEYQTPQTINVTWTHDIFSTEGKPPTRGFGGRLYFYNEKSQAIPVDGELMVYGFDDTSRDPASLRMEAAEKRFRFTAEQFTTHFSESELGASYSIWIPWDAAPGYQKKIMLIPTFKTKDGKVIRGNAASLLLPGIEPEQDSQRVIQASATSPRNPSKGQYNTTSDRPLAPPPRTTTIQLPPRSYQTQPQLSPEKAAALLEQINRGEIPGVSPNQAHPFPHDSYPQGSVIPAGALVPSSGASDSAQRPFIKTTTVPANSVGSVMPGFHMPIESAITNAPLAIGGTNAAGLPGFAQASLIAPATHSEPIPPQAPVSSVAPSSSYRNP